MSRYAPMDVAALRKALGDEARVLDALIASGDVVVGEDGMVNAATAIPSVFDAIRAELSAGSAVVAAEALRMAKAEQQELAVAEMRRDLVPYEDAIHSVDVMCGAIRSILASIGPRATRNQPERKRIDAATDRLLYEVGRTVRKMR